MATQRRRGRSFHEDFDGSGHDGEFVTPLYDANANIPQTIEHMKLSLEEDMSYPAMRSETEEDDEDDEEEEEEEQEYRGRSRSRSVHEMDANENGIIMFDPTTISNGHVSPDIVTPTKSSERSGPLPHREVETLKKGIEEAIQTRNPEEVREEQEEQLAAQEEKKQRATASTPSGDMRRIKILMLGDSGVGKSSLIIRWTVDTFSTDLVGTVGVNFKTRKVSIDGEMVQAQVWDTAGQEQFHKITTSYYRGAHGIMLVYDVSDRKSLDNVEYWVKNIKSHASETVQVALIGNKVDLRSTSNPSSVESTYGHSFSQKFGVPYFETSAKDATNVDEAFHVLISNIMASEMVSHSTSTRGAGAGTSPAMVGAPGARAGKGKCVIS